MFLRPSGNANHEDDDGGGGGGDYVTFNLFFTKLVNPFCTAVPFWERITLKLTDLSPEQDCGIKKVEKRPHGRETSTEYTMVPTCTADSIRQQ